MDNIQYISSEITFEEYNALRESVKWANVSKRQFELIKRNSVFFIIAHLNGKAVAMARLIGDCGYNFALCDVIVASEMQGQGIGSVMVRRALDYIDSITETGEKTMIHLVAAKGKEPFYIKFGFTERPNDIQGAGMSLYIDKK